MPADKTPRTRAAWSAWAEFLHRHRLENLAAWLLEAAGPLTILGAQVLHVGEPLLRPALSDANLTALAEMLEEPDEVHAFTAFLQEGGLG